MATNRLQTSDPDYQTTVTTGVRLKAIREHLRDRLTEAQYRRVALLYGFDGPPMTFREAAGAEGVYVNAIKQSADQAFEKIAQDWSMWLLWLLIHAPMYKTLMGESQGEAEGLWSRRLTDEEVVELMKRGDMAVMRGRQLHDSWEKQYEASDPYNRGVDNAIQRFEEGTITAQRRDRIMLLAAADLTEENAEEKAPEYTQEIDWALSERALGLISQETFDRRTLLALRQHVRT